MFVPAGRFSLRPKGALIDAYVADVAQDGPSTMSLSSTQSDGQASSGASGSAAYGRTVERPGKHTPRTSSR